MANKKVLDGSEEEEDVELDSLDPPGMSAKEREDDVILPESTVPLDGSEDAPVRSTQTPPPTFDTKQSCTTVGTTVVIRGKIRSDENLVVFGRIEAGIKSTKDVRLESSGIVNADMDVRCVWVAGIVVGDIHASQLVELAPEARVVGDIYTSRLIVKDGAKFRGKVEMDSLEALEALKPPVPVVATQPVAKKAVGGKPSPQVAEVIWSDVEDLAPTPAHRQATVTPQADPNPAAAGRPVQVAVTGGRVGQPKAATPPPKTPEKPAAPAPIPAATAQPPVQPGQPGAGDKGAEGDKGIGSWFRRQ